MGPRSPRRTEDLGAHMSIAGGLHQALERGRDLGCGTVQIFLKNQRQWAAPALGPEEIRTFRDAARATGIRPVFAHASYLINLATGGPERGRAIDVFTDELERAEALGLTSVVIHPGSHRGDGLETGMARVVAAVDEVTRRTPGYRVRIALENTAGAGHAVGRTVAELAAIIGRSARPERLGVCLDTCHLFASGHDIRTRQGYNALIEECASRLGVTRVLAFHLNDSRAPLGSGLDRHEHIGRGFLGRTAFRWLLNDPRFASVPKVLETPKEPEPRADRRNLATLRALRRRPAPRSQSERRV
jgi:deoxyribonuclease IV